MAQTAASSGAGSPYAVDVPLALAAYQLSLGQAEAALRTLDRVKPFEFGTTAGFLPNYIRALTYVHLRRPEDAAGQFSAVLAHRGVSPLSPILVASQLDLARAYALRRDVAKSRAAYEILFANWRSADPDLPLLKQAKAEYRKLQEFLVKLCAQIGQYLISFVLELHMYGKGAFTRTSPFWVVAHRYALTAQAMLAVRTVAV